MSTADAEDAWDPYPRAKAALYGATAEERAETARISLAVSFALRADAIGVEPLCEYLNGLPEGPRLKVYEVLQTRNTRSLDGVRIERRCVVESAAAERTDVVDESHESSLHVAGPVLRTPDLPATIMQGTPDADPSGDGVHGGPVADSAGSSTPLAERAS